MLIDLRKLINFLRAVLKAEEWVLTLVAKQLLALVRVLADGSRTLSEAMIKNALERAQARVPSPRDQILKVYGYLLDLQRVIATGQQLFALVAGEEMAKVGFRYYRDAVGILLKHYQKIVDLLPKFIDKVMEKNPGAGMGYGGKTPSSMHTGMNNVRSQAATASQSSNANPWVKSM